MVFDSSTDKQRIVVGLSGIPASGKSSLAHAVVSRINALHQQSSATNHEASEEIAIVVGFDGWHLSRASLASMPNPEEAFARRGAHWTFSADGYVKFVQSLSNVESPIFAPSFSHSTKDPVENDIRVESWHKIVLIEGLYVFLSTEPWKHAGEILDERWFVDIDFDKARSRLIKRHVETGVTSTAEEAKERAEQNDLPSELFLLILVTQSQR
jgi:pantothenate kinase